MAFLDDKPGVKEALINAINEGAKQIVISNVFLTVSSHTACGYDMINSLDCEKKYGIQIAFTEPLWNSEYLKQAFIEKVNEKIGETKKENVAIALIGYGQPDEWDKQYPTQTEQEIIFRKKIIEKFIDNGYDPENLGMAWMDFKKPNIQDLLKKFNYNKIEKLFYFAAAISADALISQVLIPEKIEKFPFLKHIQVINLGAWDAHPLVIKAIKDKIDEVLIKDN
jgi:protoheme ferro-lyase